MKLIVFDLETGGVSMEHPVIQLAAAAIEVKGPDEVVLCDEPIDHRIRFDPSKCDPEALEINSYDEERWAEEAIEEGDALRSFIELCKRNRHMPLRSKAGRPYNAAKLGGHNVIAFDIPRLLAMSKRHGDPFMGCCWWYPLDTYQGAIWHFDRVDVMPPANYRLETLARAFDLPEPTHDAMSDLRTTGYLIAKLIHG